MAGMFKLFAIALLVGVIIFPVYAFASSNSGGEMSGEGATTISGWQISNIHYELADDPTLINSVSLDLDAPADTVKVSLNSKTNDFATCTNVGAYHWQCSFLTGVKVSNMDQIRVIAVGN